MTPEVERRARIGFTVAWAFGIGAFAAGFAGAGDELSGPLAGVGGLVLVGTGAWVRGGFGWLMVAIGLCWIGFGVAVELTGW